MKIAKIKNVLTPTRGTINSAGLDFYVPVGKTYRLLPSQSVLIPSGIKANIPKGFALLAVNKSGVAVNKNLQVGACLIDEDYQGEIHLHVINIGTEYVIIKENEKLIQFICIPINYVKIVEVAEIDLYNIKTARGENGFGSTNNI